MGLISPGGENLLHFLELRQVLSTYNRDLRYQLWSFLWSFLSSADMVWGTPGVSPGESVLVSSDGMHVHFPPEL